MEPVNFQENILSVAAINDFAEFIFESPDSIWALLRSKQKVELPWINDRITKNVGFKAEILDVGCGPGLVTNKLAKKNHQITGIDLSVPLLKIAKEKDLSRSVRYQLGDAYRLAFQSENFDVVLMLNLFEHLSNPRKALSEATRVLRPGGILLYSYIERNLITNFLLKSLFLSSLKDLPVDYYNHRLFIRTVDFENWIEQEGLEKIDQIHIRPNISPSSLVAFLKGKPMEGKFEKTGLQLLFSLGMARKMREQ